MQIQAPRMLSVQAGVIDMKTGLMVIDRGELRLTGTELELLRYLAGRAGLTVSRDELLERVWGYGTDVISRAVDDAISRLRSKVERNPRMPRHLITVHGEGYRFVPMVAQAVAEASAVEPETAPRERPRGTALPRERGQMVGRRRELERLRAMFGAPGLVCISGPAGVGKTRLAIRHASNESDALDWMGFCDLRAARTTDDVVRVLRRSLGPGLRLGVEPVEGLASRLHSNGNALLVVDGMDGLSPSGLSLFDRLARLAPDARLLVTSRSRRDHMGWQNLNLAPLDNGDALMLYQMRALRPYRGESTELPDLVERLGGIPLAIELAARRAASPPETLEQAKERLPSSASLDDSIAWAWEVLPEPIRKALACGALFEGPFSTPAFARVAGLGTTEALDILQNLLDRSLVIPHFDAMSEKRLFLVLGTIRAFVLDSGRSFEGHDAATQRYVALTIERCHRLESDDRRLGSMTSATRLAAAQPDLRAALASTREPVPIAQLVGLLSTFEAIDASAVASAVEALPSGQGELACRLRLACATSERDLEAVLARAQASDSPLLLLRTYDALARHWKATGDTERALVSWRSAHDAAKRLDEPWEVAAMGAEIGRELSGIGRWAEGLNACQSALGELGSEGNSRLRGAILLEIGRTDLRRARLASAEYHLRSAMECCARGGDPVTAHVSDATLAMAAWCSGEEEFGRRLLHRSTEELLNLGQLRQSSMCLVMGGRMRMVTGHPVAAAHYLTMGLVHLDDPEQRAVALSFLAACCVLAGASDAALKMLIQAEAHAADGPPNAVYSVICAAVRGEPEATPSTETMAWQALDIGHAKMAAGLVREANP